MSARWLAIIALAMLCGVVSATSWHDDSHYVSNGPRSGYYIVRPGSQLERQLGLGGAPTINSADPFRHGYGADALAFRFDRMGVLAGPPAYIVQALPNDFYIHRLASLIRGHSTVHDVEALLGRAERLERLSNGFIIYYVIEVYNPFEDRSRRGNH